ncbi:MAG TPA: FkbM family methyltransferase [Anaerolineales bacterium]|nr:FkbM family methyltransferase [Anaerolineales bacterium]
MKFQLNIEGYQFQTSRFNRFLALLLRKYVHLDSTELKWMRKIVRAGQTVLDIGANVGQISISLSECVGKQGAVHAFEPEPQNFADLKANIETNGIGQVFTHWKAIGDYNGYAEVHISTLNSGDQRTYATAGEGKRKTTQCEMVCLDDFFPKSTVIDFVKMDIQGYEGHALDGMQALLKRSNYPPILMEFWRYGLEKSGSDPAALLARFRQQGYQIYKFEGKTLHTVLQDERLLAQYKKRGYCNLLITPKPLTEFT